MENDRQCGCQGNVNTVPNCPFIDSLKRLNFPGNNHVVLSLFDINLGGKEGYLNYLKFWKTVGSHLNFDFAVLFYSFWECG